MLEDTFDIRSEQQTPPTTEREFENALRPLSFDDFTGQTKVVDNLRIFVEAARRRGEPLDHTLLHGPPGLGKTTLSNIIANELGVGFKLTSGPVLDKPGDLAGLLTSLEPNDVLFIDEIHRLSPVVEEYLYSAMEDYRIDIMIDKGPSARSIQIDLNPFTLVGATTRSGLLTAPLRARFGINLHLEYYDSATLCDIVQRSAHILGVPMDPNHTTVKFGGIPVYVDGMGASYDADALRAVMTAHDIVVEIDLKDGTEEAKVWTCDFSYEYVKINGEYHT